MSQSKKPVYDMYVTLLGKTERMLKKSFGPKVNVRHHIGKTLNETPWLRQSLDFSIYLEDYLWEQTGRQVVFPESAAVIDNLMKARFDIDSCDGFILPFKSMIVAMPAGYRNSDGLEIPSFLASFALNDTPDEKLYPFVDSLGEPRTDYKFIASDPSTRIMVIQYRDKSKNEWGKVSVADRDLPRILKCKNAAEFAADVGDYKGLRRGFADITPEDNEIQFFALKLAASIAVYNMATEGSRLKDGFPGTSMPKLMGHDGSDKIHLSTLQNAHKGPREQSNEHYRTWFFRQLRAPRYYQGEHAHKAPGSRYVFVSDAVVGQAVEASTLS